MQHSFGRLIGLLVLLAVMSAPTIGWAQADTPAGDAPAPNAPGPDVGGDRTDWFREARFGMFIHWGPVALTGREIGWSRGRQTPREQYDQLYTRFNPQDFDAEQWAQIAADAGMKYLVITAKHHDGFCLWDSALTDYDIMATPFGRDVVAELAEACEARGIRFCVYYSIADWYHPHYTPQNMQFGGPGYALPDGVEPDMDRYVTYMKGQLEELVTRYDPGLIWFDGNWERPWSLERGNDLYQFLRELDEALIVNNRLGRGDHATQITAGDYLTPEQKLGAYNHDTLWETCMTICNQWAWKPNDPMKSLDQCLRALIICACGDGNLLFNVGPTAEGVIEERQADRLREMGDWLEVYGQTIYATRGGPWRPGGWGGSTYHGDQIYLHILDYPQGGLTLPAFGQRITDARLFHGEAEVQWSQDDRGRVTLQLPADAIDAFDTVVALTVAQPVDQLATPGDALSAFERDDRFGEVISRGAAVTTSSTCEYDAPANHARLVGDPAAAPEFAFHTDEQTHPWVTLDLGEVRTVTGVSIENRASFQNRAAGLTVAISTDGETWETLWQAEEVQNRWDVPITRPQAGIQVPGRPARYVRLRIAGDAPTYLHLRSVEVWGRE